MLEVDGLVKRYGATLALDGVSFAVEPGQVFGFVGRNGAGKTTTMRIVLGVLAADAGSVRWQGRPVDAGVRRAHCTAQSSWSSRRSNCALPCQSLHASSSEP